MTLFDLTGKRAVLCGLWHGVGEQIARTLAHHGAEVLVVEPDTTLAAATVNAIIAAGGRARHLPFDNVSANGIQAAFEEVARFGAAIDILVTTADRGHRGALHEVSEADLESMLDANVRSVYRAMRAAIPLMLETGGAIVNIASIFAGVALPQRFAYMLTKGAVVAMTRSVAADYAECQIRANCVSTARVDTDFTRRWVRETYPGREEETLRDLAAFHPLGRMGKPGEVSALILFLCSNEGAFVTGQDYVIDGGVTAVVPETIEANAGESNRNPDAGCLQQRRPPREESPA